MADSGATVNVVWDTELTDNFRAHSHALRVFQGMASFAIGEAFLDVLVLAHAYSDAGWSTKHLSSGDYDTWIVPDARIQILSLTTLTNQGQVVRIAGPTSGIFVAGRCDIFIPLFKDDRSGYYVLPVKAPSFRAAGLKPDRTRMARHMPSVRCSRMPLWRSTSSESMRSSVTLISSASLSSSVTVK
jgi:hypothetical protein